MQPDMVVHIVDDERSVRRSLALLLGAEGYATSTQGSVDEALGAIDPATAGCVVTDVRLDGATGFDLLHRLRENGIDTPVVMMTGHGDVEMAVAAMKAGVIDFIEKPFEEEALLKVVANATAVRLEQAEAHAIKRRFALLSNRERQVLERLLKGETNKVIALKLELSPRTVEIYRSKVMLKVRASSLSELIQMTIRAQLNFEGEAPSLEKQVT